MLAEDQRHVSEHFARKGQGPFDGIEWYGGETGVPLLAGVLATLECRRGRTETAGDHDIFIAEVLRTRLYEGRPLIYFDSGYHRL